MSIINFIERLCQQTAVYWAPSGYDGYGAATYSSPTEIKVRWDAMAEKTTTNDGEEFISRARIVVQQDLDFKGYLYLGELNDLETNPVPQDTDGAYEIKRTTKTPLFGSTDKFVREVYL